jgi:hypothetical protein
MADRYQDRPFPTDADHDRGANPHLHESEPLAELAQLIGQTDLFGTPAKPPVPLQSPANVRPQYALVEEEASAPAGPPSWRLRARGEAPPLQEYEKPEQPSPVYPSHRYAASIAPAGPTPWGLRARQEAPPLQEYEESEQPSPAAPPAAASERNHHEPQQDTAEQPADPSRYDDALDGSIQSVEPENAGDPAYSDDPYAYQGGYEQEPEPRTRSGWVVTVASVLTLAVVGTGAAFAYRTYVGSSRIGEPPIIKADNSPAKVAPAQSDAGASKIPDRMPPGGGGEKLVSREEAPVGVNSRTGASPVEIPPLNQNSSPPAVASVSPTGLVLATGSTPNNDPRKIKALTVKGDAADDGGMPAGAAAPAKPALPARSASTPTAPAQRSPWAADAVANTPPTLSPQKPASDPTPPTRLAATNAVQTAPSAGGNYLVQVSSEKNEAHARASYRALQNKFSAALGSRPPVIKRADLGAKGVYYRAMVGPFGSTEEAAKFCGNLKSAGGQCVVQRN